MLERQPRLLQHGDGLVQESPVEALSNAVLLGRVGQRVLMHDALVLEKGVQLVGCVLPAIVRTQRLDGVAGLLLHQVDVLNQAAGDVALVLDELHHAVARVVISHCHEVLVAARSVGPDGAAHVGVQQLTSSACLVHGWVEG